MVDPKESNFNNIIQKIIKKSLFTERQIEIILNQKDILESNFFYKLEVPITGKLDSQERN